MQEITIIGGGLAGLSLSLSLKNAGFAVQVLEEKEISNSFDERLSILNYATILLYQKLNLWSKIQQKTYIDEISISKNKLHSLTLKAIDADLQHLGATVKNADLGKVLLEECKNHLTNEKVENIIKIENGYQIQTNKQIINTKLLIIANGANSSLVKKLGYSYKIKDYQQQAILAKITIKNFKQNLTNTAFEIFYQQNIVALLPYEDYFITVISATNSIDNLEAYLKEVSKDLWNIEKVEQIAEYNLQEFIINQQVNDNLVIFGAAAHHFHPVAGQGYNLTMQDSFELTKILTKNKDFNLQSLQKYEQKAIIRQQQVILFCDLLAKIKEFKAFTLLGDFGLKIFNKSTILKKEFIKRACGIF